jgi:steroid 5-alpha reductase family enzyme
VLSRFSIASSENKGVFLMVEPLILSLWALGAVCLFTWLASLFTGNSSWVDRSWSITPILYVGIFAATAGFRNPVLILMFGLVLLWGIRLTYNFWRKGGYRRGGEDYRWPVLRERMRPWQYQLFNIGFIVIVQNTLLFLISLPAYVVLSSGSTALESVHLVLALSFLALLLLETIADQQQWNFHQRKATVVAAGEQPQQRFLTEGLFRFSRHPNFFAEQAQWWVLWGFAAVATGQLLHWSVLGPLLLSALFVGSTRFTESLTLAKYPEYRDYQARTSAIIPWFPGKDHSRTANA